MLHKIGKQGGANHETATLRDILSNLGSFTRDHSYNRTALDIVNKLINGRNLPNWDLARCYSTRGVALDNLGQKNDASKSHNLAIQFGADSPTIWETRANFWHYNNRSDLEEADLAKARLIRRFQILHSQGAQVVFARYGKLTEASPSNPERAGCYQEVHTLEMTRGKSYQIDLRSDAFDSYLRLEDAAGNKLDEDDDDGGFPHARLYFTAPETASYRIVATSYRQGASGPYSLVVQRMGGNY